MTFCAAPTGFMASAPAGKIVLAIPNVGTAGAFFDGVAWASTTLPVSGSPWVNIVYGNGSFLAVQNASATGALYSSGAWASVTLPSSAITFITFANGVFLAASLFDASTSRVYTSPTGATGSWTAATTLPSGSGVGGGGVYAGAYGNGVWVLCSGGTTTVWYSSNLAGAWSTATATQIINGQIAYGAGTFSGVKVDSSVGSASANVSSWSIWTSVGGLPLMQRMI